MRVQMLIPIAGNAEPAYSQPEFSYVAGQIVDIDVELAGYWIASGLAVAVTAPGGPQFVDDEVPAGVIDGDNAIFTLENVPNPPSSLALFNGAGERLRGGGVDYTLTGNQIVYQPAAIPEEGSLHDCSYRY